MKFVAILALIAASVNAEGTSDIPEHFATEADDQLMRLLITRGFAKEKEDDIDKKCGCDCTCC